MRNGKIKIIFVLFLVSAVLLLGVSFSNYDNESSTGHFIVNYDSSWKRVSGSEFKLKHKKTGSVVNIQSKVLEDKYVDVKLEDIVDEILYSIEEQNKDYSLINTEKKDDSKYDAFSYLYEKDPEQVLVNVYKKNNKLVIAFYQADSDCYDIVLDSVDTILNSLEIS